MEERIGFDTWIARQKSASEGLNPYCSGRKNRILFNTKFAHAASSLNPYCSGRKNRILFNIMNIEKCIRSLNPYCSGRKNRILFPKGKKEGTPYCLNPYCSGRKNRILAPQPSISLLYCVLILIVVEERIGCAYQVREGLNEGFVLILIVVEERIGFRE